MSRPVSLQLRLLILFRLFCKNSAEAVASCRTNVFSLVGPSRVVRLGVVIYLLQRPIMVIIRTSRVDQPASTISSRRDGVDRVDGDHGGAALSGGASNLCDDTWSPTYVVAGDEVLQEATDDEVRSIVRDGRMDTERPRCSTNPVTKSESYSLEGIA